MPEAQKTPKAADVTPAASRPKPIREQLQEAVNANTVTIVEKGFAGIDTQAEKLKAHLKKKGHEGLDDIVDSGTTLLKKLLARGIST